MPTLEEDDSQLKRFLDKIDVNYDGDLSMHELLVATDANQDGEIQPEEKREMRNKLLKYLLDDEAMEIASEETIKKAKQLLAFLDNPKTTGKY